MSRFLDPKYETLEAYTPGEQPKTQKLIKLNTNECPYPASPKVLAAIEAEKDYRLYSDPECSRAVNAVAKYYGLGTDQVILGNGSDEILAFSFMAYGKKIYYPSISYGFYPVFKDVFQCDGTPIPLTENFEVNPEDYYNLDGTIIIANPNAPTGIALTRNQIRGILDTNKDNLVIIDEAYVDFGAESCVPLIAEYDNLLVVQTMSKSRSLAGMRIGMGMARPEIIADLNRIKFSFNPYNLSRDAILAAEAAMEDVAYFEECTGKIKETREYFVKAMEDMGFEVLPSKANFVFAKTGAKYYEELRKRDIIVRYFDKDPIRDYVRITIGTKEQMDELLKAVEEICEA